MPRIYLRSLVLFLILSGSTCAQLTTTVWEGGDNFEDWFDNKFWTNGVPSEASLAKLRDGSAKLFSPNGTVVGGLEIAAGTPTRDANLLVSDSNLFLQSELLVGRTTLGTVNGELEMLGDSSLFGGDITIGSVLRSGTAVGTAVVDGSIFRTTNSPPALTVGENRESGSAKGQLLVAGNIGDVRSGFGTVAIGSVFGQSGFADGRLEAANLYGSPPCTPFACTNSILSVGTNSSTSGTGKAIGALEMTGDVVGFDRAEFGVNNSQNGMAEASVSIGGSFSVGTTVLGSPDGSGTASLLMQTGSKFVGSNLLVNQGSEMIMWNTVDATYINHGTGSILGLPTENTPGQVNIFGSFDQSSTGVLELNINGEERSTGYENIVVNNGVSMGGRVHLNFSENFTPKAGQVFEVVESRGRYTSNGVSISATNLPSNVAINVVEDRGLKVELVQPQPISYLFNGGANPIWHNPKNWNANQIPNSVNGLSLLNENPIDETLIITFPASIHDLIVGGVSNKMTLVIPNESKLSVTHDLELLRYGVISLTSELLANKTKIKPGAALLAEGKVTGEVENRGLLRIGPDQNTAKKLTIAGDYNQLSQGVIQMDILGSKPGEFDELFVDGDLTLNGTLSFTISSPNSIEPGAAIPLMTATGNIIGDIRLDFPLLGNNLEFGLLPATDEFGYGQRVMISGEAGPGAVGDMNRDGLVDQCDLEAFSLGLRDVMGYMDTYIFDPSRRGNINGDGIFDVDDIQPFLDLVNSRPCAPKPVPEPTSFMMLGIAVVSGAFIRRKRLE